MTSIPPWTEDETATLLRMIAAGRSFGDVATQLGRPRNGCISRYYRLQRRGLAPVLSPEDTRLRRRAGGRRRRKQLNAQ